MSLRSLAAGLRAGIVRRLGLLGIPHQFALYLAEDNLRYCRSVTTAPDVNFGPRARVHNWRGNPADVRVGDGSNICGELLVFPSGGKISMGRGCFLGENSRIWSMERVTIGDHVLISHNATIMDTDSHEFDAAERAVSGYAMLNQGLPVEQGNILTAPVAIGDNVWIGIGAIVLKGITIGPRAIVAAGSVVTRDVPSDVIVAGNPARVVRTLASVEAPE